MNNSIKDNKQSGPSWHRKSEYSAMKKKEVRASPNTEYTRSSTHTLFNQAVDMYINESSKGQSTD